MKYLQTIDQSKLRENSPRPSFAILPPKMFVTRRFFLWVKQKTETPARSGTIIVNIKIYMSDMDTTHWCIVERPATRREQRMQYKTPSSSSWCSHGQHEDSPRVMLSTNCLGIACYWGRRESSSIILRCHIPTSALTEWQRCQLQGLNLYCSTWYLLSADMYKSGGTDRPTISALLIQSSPRAYWLPQHTWCRSQHALSCWTTVCISKNDFDKIFP